MKKVLVTVLLIFGVSFVFAQDKTAKDYKIEGAEAYKAKDYQKGLTSFEQAINLYEADGKTDTSLYYNAAICAIKVDNYQKAVQYFNRSAELDYKVCKSDLYKANALLKLENYDEMEKVASAGTTKCPKYKSKFNDLLFQHYLKSGLDIFNGAAKMQAEVTPLATSDPDKYKEEMVKVKEEFKKSLPLLEKAKAIEPNDDNVNKAINQANEIIATEIK
jgi:tetratricopeptide (TPR) repeat protein